MIREITVDWKIIHLRNCATARKGAGRIRSRVLSFGAIRDVEPPTNCKKASGLRVTLIT